MGIWQHQAKSLFAALLEARRRSFHRKSGTALRLNDNEWAGEAARRECRGPYTTACWSSPPGSPIAASGEERRSRTQTLRSSAERPSDVAGPLCAGTLSGRPPGWILGVIIGAALVMSGGQEALAQSTPGAAQNVCDRTYQVRAAIVANSGAGTCAHVMQRHLREITSLDLRDQGVATLSAGDFDGLVRLNALDLSHNLLTSLPPGLFDELYLLKTLRLDNNLLDTLPADIFDELLVLEELSLNDNRFRSLPDHLFDEFSRFDGMQANGNPPDDAGAYPRIQRFLDRHDVTSREAFITALPEVFKERSVMVSASELAGKDHVSGGHPRIISFGGDGRFIFAWSTDPATPSGYRDSVEFLRQDATAWTAGVIDFSRGEPELSQPKSCRSCHGGLHKPLWGSSSSSIGTGFPESGHDGQNRGVTAAAEASTVFARRHAEVLFHRLKARSDYRRFAEETLCSASSSEVLAGALGAFSESDRDLGLLSDNLQPIQGSRNPAVDPDEPGRVRGTVGSALVFLLMFDLWQQEPIVRKLYRELRNEDSRLPNRPASIDTCCTTAGMSPRPRTN